MITVHHLEDSRSQRVLWLLEELGQAYEIIRYERDKITSLAPRALYDIHPLGKAPIITDGELTIAETGAIFEYLLDTYDTEGVFHPLSPGPELRAHRYWLHYAEGSAMTNLLLKLVFSRLPERAPFLLRPIVSKVSQSVQGNFIDPRISEHVAWWAKALETTGYFVGNSLTASDMIMSFPIEAAASRFDISAYPVLQTFLTAIHQRPAYTRALARGGAYAYA